MPTDDGGRERHGGSSGGGGQTTRWASAPRVRFIDGAECKLENDMLLAREPVLLTSCDRLASRYRLGLTGQQVVDRIVDVVAANGGGPVQGFRIVETFASEFEGAGNKGWPDFFTYACLNSGLLRYKNPAGPVYYALAEDVMAARAAVVELPFRAEFEGVYDVGPTDSHVAKRDHGIVVNRLAAELRTLGLAATNTPLIDLIATIPPNGRVIFEVKSAADRYSLYTCIGQLMVHRADASWRQVAVLPRSLNPDLRSAFDALGIHVLTFELDDTGVRFDDLASLVARMRTSGA